MVTVGLRWPPDPATSVPYGQTEFNESTGDHNHPDQPGDSPLRRPQCCDIHDRLPNLKPEADITQNYGIGYKNNDIFGGRLRASIDWSQTQIQGFVTTAASATIFANVFGRADTAGHAPNASTGVGGSQDNRGVTGIPNRAKGANACTSAEYADCGASLVQYVQFEAPCVTGTTQAKNILDVTQARLNGPGFTTNGLDYVFDYSYPLFDGDLGLNLTATETLV